MMEYRAFDQPNSAPAAISITMFPSSSNVQAQADGESVDETAEQAYKHYVVSEYIWWQNIHKYTRQKNDYDRIEGKSFADIFVWYVCGK